MSMIKVILHYDPDTGAITIPGSEVFVGTWASLQEDPNVITLDDDALLSLTSREPTQSILSVSALRDLKSAGFSAEDIVYMQQHGAL